MSFFETFTQAPDDPILGLPIAYSADHRTNKVNLGIGAYKDAEGLPVVLSAVRKAEIWLAEQNLNKEYLPIEGDSEFLKLSLELIFGTGIEEKEIFAAQTIGGTSALRIGAEFLAQDKNRVIFLPEPSWANHKSVFIRAGMKVDFYPYFNFFENSVNFDGICQAITKMHPGTVILLHACCHNPTGIDLDEEQWKELSGLIKKYHVIPFFDFAYQGFGEGLNEDARTLNYFLSQGHEMFVAYSYSKNMGLYGERAGMFAFIAHHPVIGRKVGSHIKQIIRGMYSNPSLHSGRIVKRVLCHSSLRKEWEDQLCSIRERIYHMRKTFVSGLQSKGSQKDFSFINQQKGIFSFCGLDRDQVSLLRQDFGIYMPNNGRINVAGLNLKNMDYVIDAVLSVLKK